ncbi:hypothetical protein [Streptomyces sp. NPDC005732]|uniref:hypothetical protein n=1 Tax=Streptomyces sp. NPDC005732 TaxID=3157057 RepID=UPI0033E7D1D6
MTTAAKPLPPHGSEARYQGALGRPGCRCSLCVSAWTKAGQRRRLAHLAGRPPKISPEHVTAHINALTDAGMSLSCIARAAGVSRDTVTEHARGQHKSIRRGRAALILAVRPEHADANSLVPALGSRRRIQALYAAGYGSYTIARHTDGLSARAIDYILGGQRSTVTIATRNTLADAYRILAERPMKNARTQKRAAENGWSGPGYWDDDEFENPDFIPVTNIELKRDDIATLRREEIEHFAWHGDTAEQIRARLNGEVTIGTIRQIVHQWRTGEKRDRRKAAGPAGQLAA